MVKKKKKLAKKKIGEIFFWVNKKFGYKKYWVNWVLPFRPFGTLHPMIQNLKP